MKKLLLFFVATLALMGSAMATEVTTVATAGSYLTLDQLKALSGTGGHIAFANVGGNPWTNKWLANPSANSNLTLSKVQLYTITDGSVTGKYYMQRVSDSQYRTGSGWGDQASAENIEFREYSNGGVVGGCTNPISIHNNSGTQWNINAGSFGGALNAWAAYAAYGPFYILEVTCIDETDGDAILQTSTQIVTDGHTMDIPTFPGLKLKDGSPSSIAIDGADAVYELHYVSSSFDYNVVITGDAAPDGTTFTIKGDPVADGDAVSFATAVVVGDIVVTFPGGYEYMTCTKTIDGTTITIKCLDTRWPINFDKSQTFTRSDRHINSVTFNGQTIDGLYENTSTTCYQDLTAIKTVKLLPNISVKPSFNMTGGWQHGFVYIDLNNDGDFTDDGELVSKINEGNPDLSTAMPEFTSPASLGSYRMRIKSDWASEDPGGNPGEDPGNIDGNNHIIKNGGMIVDLTLEISDDYTDQVTANIQPFVTYPGTGYFRMSEGDATTLGSKITTYKEDGVISLAEYTDLMSDLESSVDFPETGYYLIKNVSSNEYLAYGTPVEWGKVDGLVVTADITPANIIRLTNVGVNEYTISSQGLNVQTQTTGNINFPMTNAAGAHFAFTPASATNLIITNAESYIDATHPGTLFDPKWPNKPSGVVNWVAGSDAGKWTIEIATEVTVTLHEGDAGNYYATLCAPFSYTVGSGATAYTLENMGTYLKPTAIEGEVTAGTPVLLKGSSGSVTLTVGTSYAAAPVAGNLTGTYAAKTINGASDYVLGINEGVVGFYHWESNSLGANRAYVVGGAEVKGFAINFDDIATGVNDVRGKMEDGTREIFNLAGQRMSRVQKGVNIVNGKKVLIK